MEKKIVHRYKRGDPVLIYNSPELPGGGVGVVLDRDALELSYEIKDVTSTDKSLSRWVHEKNLQLLYFEKPKNSLEKLKRFLKDLL